MKNLVLMIFTILVFTVIQMPSQAASNGESDRFERICTSTSQIQSFLAPWTSQIVSGVMATPAGPVPVAGVSQILLTSSPWYDLCKLYLKMKSLGFREITLETAELLNEMTGNNFNAEMNLMRGTFDLYETTYDALSTKNPRAKLLSKRYARKLNRFIGGVNDYSEERFGENIEILNKPQEQERQLRVLSRMGSKLSKYNSYLRCPKGEPVDETLSPTYDEDSKTLTQYIRFYEADVSYLMRKFRDMGLKMSNDESDYTEFLKALMIIRNNGVKYKSEFIDYKKATKVKQSDGTFKDGEVDKKYQAISIISSPNVFSEFKEKYSFSWRGYAAAAFSTSGDADRALTLGSRRTDDEFTDLWFECRAHKFEIQLRRTTEYDEYSNDQFKKLVEEKVKSCREGKNPNQAIAENIFDHFVDEFQNAITSMKRYQASLWTLDSLTFGQMRNITYTEEEFRETSVPSEEVTCSESLNIAQLKLAQAELAALNNQSREELSRLYFEKLQIVKNKADKERRAEEEAERRRAIEAERKRRRAVDYNQYVKFPDLGRNPF